MSKYAYAELFERMSTDHALAFLEHLVKACPFKLHTILTDNGSQFTYTKAILRPACCRQAWQGPGQAPPLHSGLPETRDSS